MRGKVTFLIDTVFPARITPAYAGKSLEISLTQQACQDHPRLCGEKLPIPLKTFLIAGSPPPMRGKDDLNLFQKVVKGITPAYAGKSAVRFRSDFAEQDHPRLCGEKGCPRPDTCDIGRITPAYAGKSLPAHSRPRQIQDHPRLCGEKAEPRP